HPKTIVTHMLPFALQAVSECPAHADLALALGAEFEPVDADEADAELDALAHELSGLRHAAPRAQLTGCAAAVAERFRVVEEAATAACSTTCCCTACCSAPPAARCR